jgi:ABC-type transport system substrate-binding protein
MNEKNYWNDRYWPRVMTRRLSRRRLIQIGTLSAASIAGAGYLGCGGGEETVSPGGATTAPAGTPQPGGRIVWLSGSALSSLDPAYEALGHDKFACQNIYEWPVCYDIGADGKLVLVGLLAESVEWVDLTHLNLKFRTGIKFHDGTDFNAAAVKYQVDRVKDPATKATRAGELANIDHVEQVDDNTITYVLGKPDATVIIGLGGWGSCIPSPTAVEKYGDDFGNHPVGTGAFMFDRQEIGVSYEFKKNPNYWRPGEPFLDGFGIKVITDKAVAAAALSSGEVDGTWGDMVAASDTLRFQRDPNFDVSISSDGGIKRIFLHKGREPFNNVHLRKAMSYAINRQEIVDAHDGLAFVTPSPLPRGSIFDDPTQADPEYDPEKATAELKAAGFENGVTVPLTITTDPVDQADAELMMAHLGKVGIKVNLDSVPMTAIAAKAVQGEFSSLYMNFPSDIGSIEYSIREIYWSHGAFNPGLTVDADLDRAFEKAQLEVDPEQRKQYYQQVQKVSMENVYEIPVIGLAGIAIVKSSTHGWIPLSEPGGGPVECCFRKVWVSS